MADFCRQCALEVFGPMRGPDYAGDMVGLSSAHDTECGLFAVVLCEGCGPTQVNHVGECVVHDCVEKGHARYEARVAGKAGAPA